LAWQTTYVCRTRQVKMNKDKENTWHSSISNRVCNPTRAHKWRNTPIIWESYRIKTTRKNNSHRNWSSGFIIVLTFDFLGFTILGRIFRDTDRYIIRQQLFSEVWMFQVAWLVISMNYLIFEISLSKLLKITISNLPRKFFLPVNSNH